MSSFVQYEQEVVRLLAGPHMGDASVQRVLEEGKRVSCEHTGVGYFLTVRHVGLPAARRVCSEPTIIGRFDGLQCGFVVFLEAGELTLECHSWGDCDIPEDVRDREVRIELAA